MDTIKIKYHPAEKKIQFIGHEDNEAVLHKYKAPFVLQQKDGNQLCKDIAELGTTMDIKIEMISTKEDFKDFENIVEEYNNSQQDRKITAVLLAEFSDMNDLYKDVIQYGTQILEYVKNHSIKMTTPAPTTYEIKDDNINLCVAGVYSTGKSVLINAILGYEILPKAMKSETANIFRIKSPDNKEQLKLSFDIDEIQTILLWDTTKNEFKFITEGREDSISIELTQCLKDNSSKESYKQLYEMIKILNGHSTDISDILIEFPVPLDTDFFKFTIYDTPGTNSDNKKHQEVLSHALSEQSHSIMIFVIAPDKIEGTGNKTILKELKGRDSYKTNIDVDRSIFVMNKADSSSRNELEISQRDIIKEEDIDIDLKKQKLFFLSAIQGYIAKATKNNSDIRADDYSIKNHYDKVNPIDEEEQFYRYNRYGESNIRTKQILQKSNDKLSSSSEKHDQIMISSGLYALESEIQNYGEKYFVAVKAYSVITSIKNFLKNIENEINILKQEKSENVEKLENDIKNDKERMLSAIKDKAEFFTFKEQDYDNNIFDELKISDKYIESYTDDIYQYSKNTMSKLMMRIKKIFFIDLSKGKTKRVNTYINRLIARFQYDFKSSSESLLKKRNKEFLEYIKDIIKSTEELDQKTQEYITTIDIVLNSFTDTIDTNQLFDDYKKQFFKFFEKVDVNSFNENLTKKNIQLFNRLSKNLKDEFIKKNHYYIDQIKRIVQSDLELLSVLLRKKISDKDKINKDIGDLETYRENLQTRQCELEKLIWQENHVK